MPELRSHPQWYKHYRAALKMAQDGGTIALLGPRGTGKTQAAIEVIRHFCAQSVPDKMLSTLYTTADELFQHIRSAYGPNGKLSEDAAVSKFIRPKLLVVDELQEVKGSDFEKQKLTLIMDKRYGSMKPTILVANLEPKHFFSSVGSSVESRMDEGGGHFVFNWESFRKLRKE